MEALRRCRSSPSIGKGPERKEVLPSGGNNVTDGRGRVGMRAARAEGLGKEPDRLETGCEFRGSAGSMVVRAWSQPGNEVLQGRKKWAGFRGEGAEEDSKVCTSGGLRRGDSLTGEVWVGYLFMYFEGVEGLLLEKPQM